MNMKTLFFTAFGASLMLFVFTSQQKSMPAQTLPGNGSTQKMEANKNLPAVNITLASAVSKIQDKEGDILEGYNMEAVAGGVAVYGVTKSSSAANPILSVQFYHGSNTANPSTTSILWSNAEAAATNSTYSVAFPLVDGKQNVVGYVVVGSASRPDLDQEAINKALAILTKGKPQK